MADPEVARRVLVTNSVNYRRDDVLLKFLPALGTGLVTSNGRAHAIQRKHLHPAFTLESVKDYLPIFNEKSIELAKVGFLFLSGFPHFDSFARLH